MALLQAAQGTITGTPLGWTPADAAGDQLDGPVGQSVVLVRNGGTAAVTVTTDVPGTTHGQANPDVPVSVPAGGIVSVGPFPRGATDGSGRAALRYSATAGVDVAALYVPGA